MKRFALAYLQDWLFSDERKPMVIRGARQVGKTWLVEELARVNQLKLIGLNFENNPQQASAFNSNSPKDILLALSAMQGEDINPYKSILFLDEIQAAPQLFAKLRWFAEQMPELAVVAAGSLLEFVLAEHDFSMPVGRVTFMHLEPLSFEEFVFAQGKEQLIVFLREYDFSKTIPEVLHTQLMNLFKEFILVGGMPRAVNSWSTRQSFVDVNRIHHDLLTTYRADFSKYRKRIPLERLEEAMLSVPRLLGQKFMFSQVNSDVPSEQVKQAILLLNQARVCHRVVSTAADGVPLGSQIKPKFFKEIFLDVGLVCASLGVTLQQVMPLSELTLANSGAIAEQVVGQLLRTVEPFYVEPCLYYWHRDVTGSQAELDYVIQHNGQIVPIEVKAGAAGTLKSLKLFMNNKQSKVGVRVYSGIPGYEKGDLSLFSVPFYLCGQLHRLLDTILL